MSPACHLVTIAPAWLSPVGLSLDFVGVILLGIDLVRVQGSMKQQANADLARFNAMVEEHGGTEEWVKFIKGGEHWIDPDDYYPNHSADDDVSVELRSTKVQLKELMQAITNIAEATTKLITFQHEQAKSNARVADASIRFSIWGLSLICVGFVLQLIAAIQLCSP